MRPRSLRARVAIAAAAAVAVAAALLGIAILVLVEREQRAALDRTLHRRAVEVARLSATAPALLTAPGALDAPLAGAELVTQIVDRRGRVVARSSALASAPPLPASLTRRSGFRDASVGSVDVRVFVAPLAETGGAAAGGAVVVAASTAELEATFERLRRVVAVAALLAGGAGALAGAMATRRALRPLGSLAGAAGEIERTGDAALRLPGPGTGDEVDALAATLNAMLAALERARAAEQRFVADASHELRTPLTALRGNAAYVARHGADPAALAAIEEDADRLARLLDDLLALAREDAGGAAFAPVELDELAREAAASEPRASVRVEAALTVDGDRAALARALGNLVSNAALHGPPDGAIEVFCERRGSRAAIGVTDSGAGIAPADAERALTRFWRAPEARAGAGSGLGLAIVRATADRHGGSVRIDGPTVAIELPLSSGSQDRLL